MFIGLQRICRGGFILCNSRKKLEIFEINSHPSRAHYLGLVLLLVNTLAVAVDDASLTDSDYGLDTRPPNPSCVAPNKPTTEFPYALELIYENAGLSRISDMIQRQSDPDHWYASRRHGQIYRFPIDPDTYDKTLVLDLNSVFAFTALESNADSQQ